MFISQKCLIANHSWNAAVKPWYLIVDPEAMGGHVLILAGLTPETSQLQAG